MSLYRHYDDHLPETLTKAHDAEETARADQLLADVQQLQRAAQHILSKGLEARDYRTALGAIREACRTLELQARLVGELTEATTVNVLVTPEWQRVQATILSVLAPHPMIRARVAAALTEVTHVA